MLSLSTRRRSQKPALSSFGRRFKQASGLIFLGIAKGVGASNADLCSGFDLPQTYGTDDGHVIGFCFATHANAAAVTQGYWISGWTDSATLIGAANNGAFALYLDTSYQTTEKIIFNDDSLVGFDTAASCDANDTTDEAAFITLDPMTVIFHTTGGATNAYRLQHSGTTLADYEPGNTGYNQAIIFRSGTLYFGIDSNTGADDPYLVSMQPNGTINWALKYVDYYTSSVTVFTSIYKDGNTLYPITVQRVNSSYTLNVLTKVTASTGANAWTYAEYYGGTSYYIVYIYQDFVSNKYLLCNNSHSDHELEYVYYTLDGSGNPHNHHYFVYYEYISGLYTGIRCAGAYLDADGTRGVVVYNKVYSGAFSKQCITYQNTNASYDISDFFETCIDNSALGLGEIAFTNPAWWIPADFSFNVLYWDVEVGQVLYPKYVAVISSIKMANICNSAYHTESTQNFPTSKTGSFAYSLDLYYSTAGYVDPAAATLTSISVTVSIVDIIEDVQEAIQPCEVVEIDVDPTTVYYNEQTTLTHQHSDFTIYLDTCFGDNTIEFSSNMRDNSAFPSWMTYDPTTRTYSITDDSVQGTYTLDIVATTEGGLLDEENYFDLVLLPFNIAPVITVDVVDDLLCYVNSDCSQTITVTDRDSTDTHSLVCTTDIVPINLFIDCSSGTTISILPLDNVLDIGTYVFTIVVWDDDSDSTGIPLSANSIGFTLTVLPQVDDAPYWSGSFKQKVYVDISDDPPLEWRPPQYGAPDITEMPFENVTMMEGGKPPAWVEINRLPLILTLNPDDPLDVGKYELNVTVTFNNYGTMAETYRLEGELTVIVSNYEPCFAKGKFPDVTLKLGESGESRIEKWEDVEFVKPCVDLKFVFTHDQEFTLPYPSAPFIVPEKSRWVTINPTLEAHTGVFSIQVFAEDYIISKRLLDTFKVTVIGFKNLAQKDENFLLEEQEPPLDCKIASVTPEGEVTLSFNKEMQQIDDLTAFEEPYPAFDFFINPREAAYDEYLAEQEKNEVRRGASKQGRRLDMNQFHENSIPDTTMTADSLNYIKNWTVTSMGKKDLKFQLYFDERYVISQQPVWDNLHLDILDPRNLVSMKGEQLPPKDLKNKAPPFVAIGDWLMLDLLGSLMYYFILVALLGCLPILLWAGGSTQSLWIFLSFVQLTCHLPQLGTYFPNNVERMLVDVMYMVNFKFYKFNPFIGIYKEYFEINYQGYSDNVIFSMGTLIVYYFGLMVLTFICYQLYQRVLYAYRVPRTIMQKLGNWFIGNFFIRLLLQTYLVFCIATFMNLGNMSFKGVDNILGASISILFAPILIGLPFLMTWLLLIFRYDLPYLFTINRFESAYNELRTHRTGPLMYNVVQVSRRLIVAIIISAFRDAQAIQFQPLAFTSMMCCYFSIYYQPFHHKYLNRFDLFTEGVLVLLCYMVAAFTDYVEDDRVTYLFGEAWLCIFLASFYLSFIYVVYKTIYFALLKLRGKLPKKYWQKYRYVKQHEYKPKFKHFQDEMDPDATSRSLISDKVRIGVMKQNQENQDTNIQDANLVPLAKQKTKKFKTKKAKIGLEETGLVEIDVLKQKEKKDKKEKKDTKDKKDGKNKLIKRTNMIGLGNQASVSVSTLNSVSNASRRGSIKSGIGLTLVKRLKKKQSDMVDDAEPQKHDFLAPGKQTGVSLNPSSAKSVQKNQNSPLSPANDKKALLSAPGSENPKPEKSLSGPKMNYRQRESGFFKQVKGGIVKK